jgi:hypothetical protein
MDGGMDFTLEVPSDAKIKDAGSSSKSPSRRPKLVEQPDSGVRIVPLDEASDSDVKVPPQGSPGAEHAGMGAQGIKAPSDSDIRIEKQEMPSGGRRLEIVTEEIDLDAEARKAAETMQPGRPKPGSAPALPTASPFELSEPEIQVGAAADAAAPAEEAKEDSSSSSDFELNMGDESSSDSSSSSDFEINPEESSSPVEFDSDEAKALATSEDEVSLGELKPAGGSSGINLQDPADSGISLEQSGSDEIEFELSLDSGASPKPAGKAAAEEESDSGSSSEFELSLDKDPGEEPSSSEFELNLDVDSSGEVGVQQPQSDSDSEFELTLDEGGGLSVEGSEAGEGEKDVFETEFEVPALDEESGSEAVALDEADTDMETSDFDLSLEDQAGEDSGSDAMALEEEAGEEAGAAVAEHEGEAEGFGDLEEGEAEPEEQLEEEEYAAPVAAAPAEWGVLPAVALIPSVVILFLVCLMSFEVLQGMWGYHKPAKVSSLIVRPLANANPLIDDKLPED